MDLPLIIFAACILAAAGGRAQLTIGQLADKLPQSPILPLLILLSCALTASIMANLGSWISGQFIGFPRALIIASGLALAALDLFRSQKPVQIREPTRSLGAISLALTGKQLFDAPRWLAFAGGAAIVEPLGIALGATFGSAIVLSGAWLIPELRQSASKFRNLRIVLAALIVLAAALVVWIGTTTGP